jgi:hypothetical protein
VPRQYFTSLETIAEGPLMNPTRLPLTKLPVWTLAFLLFPIRFTAADEATPSYPSEAASNAYRIANVADEIALARSAAPDSIAADASILTLGDHGYDTAVHGKNGFVCLVERSWANTFSEPEFWNPKIRAPICFNAAAARSVLPDYLEKTRWALARASKADMIARHKTEAASKPAAAPESGAMSYMLSKQAYLGDGAGHWHPHLMFFSTLDAAAWGADSKGSPVSSSQVAEEAFRTFYIKVNAWSDGTQEDMKMP